MGTTNNFNYLIYITLSLSIVLLVSSTCQAEFQEGVAAHDRGDYKTALKEFRISAEQGYAQAQSWLGSMYDHGEGVPENDTEAVKWYRKAAEQGYAPAQAKLGFMYDIGEGVPEDNIEAVKWFRKAAEQRNVSAQGVLGVMYFIGKGVPKNYIQAYAWLNLAVSQGGKAGSETKEILRKRMTPSQIAKAQALSHVLYERIYGK